MAKTQQPGFQILVVDDEQPVLELMAEILGECGWTVTACGSPLDALDRVRRTMFDAIVLDLYMPELPGMLLHAKIKLIDRELAQRTLFVTGHFSREELRRDLQEEGNLLLKPFEPSELARLVARVLPVAPRSRRAVKSSG